MSDKVLVAVPGLGVLALEPDVFRQALAQGATLAGRPESTPGAPVDEPLLEAEELAEVLKLPVTWIEQAAREDRIPSIQAGRWRRFKRSAVEAVLTADGRGRAA
jgi:excisionase family DNA binding protein